MSKKMDLTGKKFNHWTVLYEAETRKNSKRYWYCRCDCGIEKEVSQDNLINNKTLSCGCINKKENLVGQRFGRLVVTREASPHRQPNGKPVRMWYCDCDCGTKDHIVCGSILKSGDSQSCGCKLRDKVYNRPHMDLTNKKFGHWTVLYEIEPIIRNDGTIDRMWHLRCDCPNHTEKDMLQRSFLYGDSTHCGCISKEGIPNYNLRKENIYDLSKDYGIGFTYDGFEFYFDLDDYELIKDYYWIRDEKGYIKATSRVDKHNGQIIQLHRLVMDVVNNNRVVVDHIGGEITRHDNRKMNLRIATYSENNMNQKLSSKNTSGVVGVCLTNRNNKELWRAYINKKGKQFHLGYYEKFDDAVKARKEAEEKYFGEWSYDNSQEYSKQNNIL